MKIAIVGTGLQAVRRAEAIIESSDDQVVFIASTDEHRGMNFAKEYGVAKFGVWEQIVEDKNIEGVVVCTTPDTHAKIVIPLIEAGKHILCEKPLTKDMSEAYLIQQHLTKSNITFQCGFNHRFHPGIMETKKIIEQSKIGKVLNARCRYGICGRENYSNEWRGNKSIATGGQLMELGIHPIDLFHWIIGDIKEVSSMVSTSYFKIDPLEDNGMALLKTENKALCFLHASLTQWKNLFSFEITGEEGYTIVEGLGDSYGDQKFIFGKKDYSAPFSETITVYRGKDQSWANEWSSFKNSINTGGNPSGSINDAIKAMKVVFACYESSKIKKNIMV
jgi:predicted dehydrogenase